MFWATALQDVSKWENLPDNISLEEKLQKYEIRLYSNYKNAHEACDPKIEKGVVKVSIPSLQSEILNQKEYAIPAYQVHYDKSLFEDSNSERIKKALEKARAIKHQADINEAKEELDELYAEIDSMQEDIEKLTKEIELLNEKIAQKNIELAKKDTELLVKDEELAHKEVELAQRDEALEIKENEIKTAKEQNKSYAKASEDLNNVIFAYESELKFKKQHLDEMENRAQEMENRAQEMENRAQEMENRAQEMEKLVQTTKKEKEELEVHFSKVEQNYKTIAREQEKRTNQLENVVETLSNHLSETESKLILEQENHNRTLQKTAALKWELLNAANHFHQSMEQTLNSQETQSRPSVLKSSSGRNSRRPTTMDVEPYKKPKQSRIHQFIAKNSFESSAALAGTALYFALDGISATTGALGIAASGATEILLGIMLPVTAATISFMGAKCCTAIYQTFTRSKSCEDTSKQNLPCDPTHANHLDNLLQESNDVNVEDAIVPKPITHQLHLIRNMDTETVERRMDNKKEKKLGNI